MKNPLHYLRKHPQLAKQIIGLTLTQLERLIKQAIAQENQLKREAEKERIRVNKKGAGRPRSLTSEEEVCLCLFYLRQMPIFEVLGMIFDLCRTTANDLFHYWLPILRELLPSSLLEDWEKSIQDDKFVKELLTSYQLLVDSSEQSRERPKSQEEQEEYYSGKQKSLSGSGANKNPS